MPAAPDSVDELLARLRQGDQPAATALFKRFAFRLLALAHDQLSSSLRRKVDAEDVVQSVFRSFFTRQRDGRFQVDDWDDLWALLATITVRKCINVRIAFHRQGRSLQREVDVTLSNGDSAPGWEALAREPTPTEAAMLTELVEGLLQGLPERERRIVALTLEGKDAKQISQDIGRAERTVRRVVEHFRQRLEHAVLTPASLD
jgi:RNA polymerase sigma-70 factor, ECF subfamily